MGKVILDDATCAKLNGLTEKVALYDERGALIGYAIPPERDSFAYGPFTDAEIEEAFAQTGPGRPLADILAELRGK
jgi:hypothetical protein